MYRELGELWQQKQIPAFVKGCVLFQGKHHTDAEDSLNVPHQSKWTDSILSQYSACLQVVDVFFFEEYDLNLESVSNDAKFSLHSRTEWEYQG